MSAESTATGLDHPLTSTSFRGDEDVKRAKLAAAHRQRRSLTSPRNSFRLGTSITSTTSDSAVVFTSPTHQHLVIIVCNRLATAAFLVTSTLTPPSRSLCRVGKHQAVQNGVVQLIRIILWTTFTGLRVAQRNKERKKELQAQVKRLQTVPTTSMWSYLLS